MPLRGWLAGLCRYWVTVLESVRPGGRRACCWEKVTSGAAATIWLDTVRHLTPRASQWHLQPTFDVTRAPSRFDELALDWILANHWCATTASRWKSCVATCLCLRWLDQRHRQSLCVALAVALAAVDHHQDMCCYRHENEDSERAHVKRNCAHHTCRMRLHHSAYCLQSWLVSDLEFVMPFRIAHSYRLMSCNRVISSPFPQKMWFPFQFLSDGKISYIFTIFTVTESVAYAVELCDRIRAVRRRNGGRRRRWVVIWPAAASAASDRMREQWNSALAEQAFFLVVQVSSTSPVISAGPLVPIS